MKRDPELARRFTRMLYEIHQPLAEALVEFLDLEGVERLLDVGGGSGVVSLALLRRHPGLRATVADIDNVCLAGREIADQTSQAERITYHATDFVEDELPTGFDLVLECDVNVFGERLFGNNNWQEHIVVWRGGNSPVGGQLGDIRGQEVTAPGKKGLGKLGSLFNHNRLPFHVVCPVKISHIELGCSAWEHTHRGAVHVLGFLDAQFSRRQKSLTVVKVHLDEIQTIGSLAGQ